MKHRDYMYPIELLDTRRGEKKNKDMTKYLEKDTDIIEGLMEARGVNGRQVHRSVGINHLQYEWELEPGESIAKVKKLKDELELMLGVSNIEFEIPVTGKNTVGITVPRSTNSNYSLRDALMDERFLALDGDLQFVAGCDFRGKPVYGDLAVMPHLIVGGTTGSGKTVFLDSVMMSLMCKYTSEEVKLILVDTKGSDFKIYQKSPYLFGEVITDLDTVFAVFDYLLREMHRRHDLMAELEVRNVHEYNLAVDESRRMARLVVIIDDIADIMLARETDMVQSVQNLTLLARAAGIHFVFSTHSPTSRVLTGPLCANFISRAVFSVADRDQSIAILGESGAEKLSGNGELLFFQTGYYSPKRLHGAYVSEPAIKNVITWQKKQ